jgi:hypothetical protein
MTLTNERHCWEAAERGGTLGETALAKERHRSLLAVQAAGLALPKPALAKDKQHQEDTASKWLRPHPCTG